MIWKRSSSPPPKKARMSKSAKKFMFIFFMDSDGMLNQHAVPADSTTSTGSVQTRSRTHGLQVFSRLKADLRGNRYENLDHLRKAVRSIVRSYNQTWYSGIFSRWFERHRKCIVHKGEYFEKG
ncbi:hypothetical protein MAR_027755 [Mya arenaria]|uniref:Uncharacterized protein n=1 Tax=Mya arenaria TaxID=6604 RepID=A0ABY7EUS0_MYAAR|nr:hypothetical protein MAR_027755 [Mya arenaria]